ncbi:MAG: phosphoglycerate kinase [bacterium]
MKLRSYKQASYHNKTVIYRATYDITLQKRGNSWCCPDVTRIKETIPSILWLKKRANKIVIVTWLGRPKKANDPQFKINAVANRLRALLKMPIIKLDDCVGPQVREKIKQAKPGSIILLENVRFHKEEQENSIEFAKELARNGDLVVNDAFGQCHRKVSSIVGLQKYLPSYAGPLLEKEVTMLDRVLKSPKRPLVAIIGGAKIKTKVAVINKLLKQVNYLLLGGALSNTILAARGIQIGKSVSDTNIKKIIKKINLNNPKLHIPIDVVTSRGSRGKRGINRRPVGKVRSNEYILDIGPDTVTLFGSIIKKAKMVVWNGPMGFIENSKFAYGTKSIAQQLAKSKAETVVGGGDTLAILNKYKLVKKMTHISTGGGAMMVYLEKGTLPGLEPIRIK